MDPEAPAPAATADQGLHPTRPLAPLPPARLIAVLRATSGLGIAGGVLAVGGGSVIALSGLGETGLAGLVVVAGIVVGLFGIGLVALSATLYRAIGSIGSLPFEASPGLRRRSTIVSATAAALWAGATLGLMISARDLPLPFVAATAAVTVLAAGGGYLARFVPSPRLRASLLAVVLLSLVPAARIDLAMLGEVRGRVTNAIDAEALPGRMEQVRNGPDGASLATALGGRPGLQPWRIVAAGTYPGSSGSAWTIDPRDLADLAGREIRAALLGQCWGTPQYQTLTGTAFLVQSRDGAGEVQDSYYFSLPNIRCTGTVGACISANGPALVPSRESLDAFAAAGRSVFEVSVPMYPETAGPRAERWLLLVTDQPQPSLDGAVEAFEQLVR